MFQVQQDVIEILRCVWVTLFYPAMFWGLFFFFSLTASMPTNEKESIHSYILQVLEAILKDNAKSCSLRAMLV